MKSSIREWFHHEKYYFFVGERGGKYFRCAKVALTGKATKHVIGGLMVTERFGDSNVIMALDIGM